MRRSSPTGIVALALFFLAQVALPALAQPTPEQDREARSLFEAGQEAFSAGHFDRALEYFQRAYDLSDRAPLLFNIANCHDRLRHTREAIDAFELYVERVPDAPNIGFARTRITALTEELQREGSSGGGGETTPSEGSSSDPGAEDGAGEGASEGGGDPGLSDRAGGGGPSVAGIALLVGGGLVVAGGLGALGWFVDRQSAVDFCPTVSCRNLEELEDERNAAAGTMAALLGVGAALMVVGAVVLAVDGGDESEESASLECAPSLGGLACRGRF